MESPSYKMCIIALTIFVSIKIILYNEIIQNKMQNLVNCCTMFVPTKTIQYNKIIHDRKQSGTRTTNEITSSTYIDQAVTRSIETTHCIPPTKFNKQVIEQILIFHLEKHMKTEEKN